MSNTSYDFRHVVADYAKAQENIEQFGEGDLISLSDKGIPIPADKVGTADSVDKDKVPIVDRDGKWQLGTINQPISQDLSATFTPVANTYYLHTGTTTSTYTQGIIYFYNGTAFKAINGESGGAVIITTSGTMQTSTLPAYTVPLLTTAQIQNINSLISQGKSVIIDDGNGQYTVTESDNLNNEIRFTYFGLYLGYYIEGNNVIAVYDMIGRDSRIPTTTSADAGKFLTVDNNGDIVVTAIETWQGGNF